MNVFRFCADSSHLIAIVLLLVTLIKSRSCSGLSGFSQILFALVFTTRYIDLFVNFYSIYNSTLKVLFILLTYLTVFLIYVKYRDTYDRKNDNLPLALILIILSGLLSLLINYETEPMEVLWTFSIYLESVAILPQLFMINKGGKPETITVKYLTFLGMYRALYIANWIYRYCTTGYFDIIAAVAGCIQTILYVDFFYMYLTAESLKPFDVKEKTLDVTNI